MKGIPIGAVFQNSGLPKKSGPTLESLPAGYIPEYGAQITTLAQGAHQALVMNAVELAYQTELVTFAGEVPRQAPPANGASKLRPAFRGA